MATVQTQKGTMSVKVTADLAGLAFQIGEVRATCSHEQFALLAECGADLTKRAAVRAGREAGRKSA